MLLVATIYTKRLALLFDALRIFKTVQIQLNVLCKVKVVAYERSDHKGF